MKNLKKVLALVLVVAMMASFATVSAAFPDADSISYKTAVDVLAGLGVVSGYGDGTFRPTNLVTRGHMAKMVAYVMNGGVNAAASYGAAAVAAFDDVASTNTFANGIGYVASKGIVAGYPDGTFRPSANVTGVAAAKMLLGALGYSAAAEGYENNTQWKTNVINAGEEAGLFAGMATVDLNANLTREAAAQMIWNALNAKTVKYTTSGTTITAGDITITTGATRNDVDWAEQYTGDVQYIADGKMELVEKCFPTLTSGGTEDSFGRPGVEVKLGDKVIATSIATAAYKASAPATNDVVAKALGLKADVNNVPVVVSSSTYSTGSTWNFDVDGKQALNVAGNTVEVFCDAQGTPTKVLVIVPTVTTVTGVVTINATATAGGYTQYTINATPYKVYNSVVNPLTEVDSIVLGGTVAMGDTVLFNVDKNGTAYVSPVSVISGDVTSITSAGVYTIGGANYTKAAWNTTTINLGKNQAFYVDANNYIVATKQAAQGGADPFGLVLTKDSYQTLVDNKIVNVHTATLVNVDGSVVTVNTAAAVEDAVVGTVVTYKQDPQTSLYTLSTTDAEVAVNKIAKGISGLTDNSDAVVKYANAATKYVFVNWTKNALNQDVVAGTVNVVTGADNVGTYTGLVKTYALDLTAPSGDTIADVVFIYDNKNAESTATSNLIYVLGNYTQSAAGYTYDVIVNGAPSTVTMATECLNKGLYKSITEKTSDAATADLATTVSLQNNGGLLFLGGTYSGKSIANTTPIYVIRADGSVASMTAADIVAPTTANTLGVDSFSVYYTATQLNAVTSIVIVCG